MLKLIGKQNIEGMEFEGIEGGFGEGKRCMLVKDIARLHGKQVKYINKKIKDNRERFNNDIDIIDLKTGSPKELVLEMGFSKAEYGNANNIYLLSERGYSKLLKILEDDLAWEQYDKLVDGYFAMRGNQLSPQEQLALQLFNGGIDAITAHKKLLELETKPLLEKIVEDKPKVQIADERLLKNGCYTITEINRSLGLKRGRLTKWAKEQGYIHKTITEVNESGRPYFKIYDNGGYKAIGITEEGLSKIQENLENIK